MRMKVLALLVIAWLLAIAATAVADDENTTQAPLRYWFSSRYGLNYINDQSDEQPFSYHDLNTRLNLQVNPGGKERAIFELSDYRCFGVEDPNHTPLRLSQAYVSIPECIGNRLGGDIGRMRYRVGNERIIGNDNWGEGRSFDGGTIHYGDPKVVEQSRYIDESDPYSNAIGSYFNYQLSQALRLEQRGDYYTPKTPVTVEGFGFKMNEGDKDEDDDHDLMGLNVHIPKAGLMPFGYYDRMNRRIGDHRQMHLYTAGLYFDKQFGGDNQILLNGNLAYQFGSARTGPGEDDKLDIGASLIQADAGVFFKNYQRPFYVGGGVDLTSGDDDFTDDSWGVWNNQVYSHHGFRGLNDLFVQQPFYGLQDFYLRTMFFPTKHLSLGADLHILNTAKDFASVVDGEDSKSIGNEIDIYGVFRSHERFNWGAEVNITSPSEDFGGQDADSYMTALLRGTYFFF